MRHVAACSILEKCAPSEYVKLETLSEQDFQCACFSGAASGIPELIHTHCVYVCVCRQVKDTVFGMQYRSGRLEAAVLPPPPPPVINEGGKGATGRRFENSSVSAQKRTRRLEYISRSILCQQPPPPPENMSWGVARTSPA